MRSFGVRIPWVFKTRGLVVNGCVENEEPRSQGVENTGLVKSTESGAKHGVWWKTRSLSGKHGNISRKQGVPCFFFFVMLFYFS